jgi:hypothetical protein
MVEQRRRAEEEARKRASNVLHPIQATLLDLVKEHDEPEIRNTKLAHAFAKIAGYHSRKERDAWIKKAWQHLTALIRRGKLEWATKRNHVQLAPPEKQQAFEAKVQKMIDDLPEPNI